MNNDLQQFSEERLKELVKNVLVGILKQTEIIALARIALAAKQAKPVAYIADCGTIIGDGDRFFDDYKNPQPLYATPQPAHTEQVIKITQVMLDAAVADCCTTGKYTVENIPYELRRQVELEAKSTFNAMLAAAPKPESE